MHEGLIPNGLKRGHRKFTALIDSRYDSREIRVGLVQQMRESPEEQSPVKPLKFLRVLAVEDFERFRRFMCVLLQDRIDCRIVGEASDGLEAIQKIQELQPDLILLDIGLPKLDGIKVAERAGAIVPDAKLLFISQESSSDVIQKTFQVGGQAYIHKPRVQNDLLPAIEAVLRGEIFVSAGLSVVPDLSGRVVDGA